jgi:hypothetical protein
MIIFVVVQHVAVTYSGLGDWYYVEQVELGIAQTIIFGFYQSFTQSYFMGLMFLIAGYFVPVSYDKKGFGGFINDRIVRLGIPTAIYMIIIHPVLVYGIMGHREEGAGLLASYADYIINLNFIGESGPLWFAFALLIFSVIYALIRKCFTLKAPANSKGFPSLSAITALILLMSLCSFLVRIVQPIGTNILNMQLCFFSQYVILFAIGIACKRNGWFEKLSYNVGKRWLISGLSFGFILFLTIMISGGALDGDLDSFYGGIQWQSAAYSVWEAFVSVSMSIGLIALFKEKFNKQNELARAMSDNAFCVYVFHAPIVVALSYLFAPVTFLPIVKFIIFVVIAIPVCFLSVNFTIRKIHILRKLFS